MTRDESIMADFGRRAPKNKPLAQWVTQFLPSLENVFNLAALPSFALRPSRLPIIVLCRHYIFVFTVHIATLLSSNALIPALH